VATASSRTRKSVTVGLNETVRNTGTGAATRRSTRTNLAGGGNTQCAGLLPHVNASVDAWFGKAELLC